MRQNNIAETLVGAAVVAVAIAFLAFGYLRTGSGSLSGYEINAKLSKVDGLSVGTDVRLSFMGAHAYVSPDWYETPTRVPTWNYSAVEGQGALTRLSEAELRTLLIDLSAAEEAKLLPKKPWTIDKVPGDRMAALMNAIVGFSVRFEALEGKFKLSQNTTAGDIAGVVRGLEARGDAAVARAMRNVQP